MEKRIDAFYNQKGEELSKEFLDYLNGIKAEDEAMAEELDEDELAEWRMARIMLDSEYQNIQGKMAKEIASSNMEIRNIIRISLPLIYALNYNFSTYDIEKKAKVDTGYKLKSTESVQKEWNVNKKIMPDPVPQKEKDMKEFLEKSEKWNNKQINSVVMQGVKKGSSIPNIAKEIEKVTGMEKNRSITLARTIVTGVENSAIEGSIQRAYDLGIEVEREWLATLDDRTRHEHRLLDGQIRAVGEPFKVEKIEIMFPGDTSAPPFMIYNCRCRLIPKVEGIGPNLSDKAQRKNKLGNMTYDEWKIAKRPKEKKEDDRGENR